MPQSNNIRTAAFGPPGWFVFHLFAMGYPSRPTSEDIRNYMEFYRLFGKTLPCNLCRDSYQKFWDEEPLTRELMQVRYNFIKWTFRMHDKVNKKLEKRELLKLNLQHDIDLIYLMKQLNLSYEYSIGLSRGTKDMYCVLYEYYEKFSAGKCKKRVKGCTSAREGEIPYKTKVLSMRDLE